ncbi:MAG: hypothetical protein EBY57_06270 [Actinobacteria bacterium]|nr:hypothetical protein [Actinomycetota bacterium]
MEPAPRWVSIPTALRKRICTRRTVQLAGTAVLASLVIVAGVWLFSPPESSVDDGLTSAAAETDLSAGEPPGEDDAAGFVQHVSVSIHVAGEVHISAAEGPTERAELDALNLAAFVADGERIYVPAEDEIVAGSMIDIAQGVGTLVNLNRASAIELETLPGIGPATAAEIVNDRSVNGPFSSVDDLVRVSGVGPATVEKLRDVVSV